MAQMCSKKCFDAKTVHETAVVLLYVSTWNIVFVKGGTCQQLKYAKSSMLSVAADASPKPCNIVFLKGGASQHAKSSKLSVTADVLPKPSKLSAGKYGWNTHKKNHH